MALSFLSSTLLSVQGAKDLSCGEGCGSAPSSGARGTHLTEASQSLHATVGVPRKPDNILTVPIVFSCNRSLVSYGFSRVKCCTSCF